MTAASARNALLGLLLVSLLAKLWLSMNLPLFGDEAFYWLEGQHPSWAHDDVPGLTPWLIRLGVLVGGNREWAVRLPFMLIALLSLVLIVQLGRALDGAVAGWVAASLALLLPLFAAGGLLALPDVPLTLAVLLCVEALRRLLAGQSHGPWLLAAGLAVGWLSHYRFVVPMFAAGAWLLLHPAGRQLLLRPTVWVAGLAGTLGGLAPLLWHNVGQSGGGFAFQFVERHPWRFQPEALLDLPLQALVATPLLFILLLAGLLVTVRHPRRAEHAMVGGIALCLLATYMLLAPFVDTERSRLHWPLPALLLATVLAPGAIARSAAWMRRGWQAAMALAAAVLGALGVLGATLALTPHRLASSDLYLHGFTGWREASAEAREALRALPDDTLLVADHFMLAAQLGFAFDGQRPVFSLDHPINRKHGRQGELGRMRLDEAALLAQAGGRPLLLLLEESASRLRERPAWYRRLCERFPGARPLFDRSIDHGRKRLIGYYREAGAETVCVPPAVGYLDRPLEGDLVSGPLDIAGWALRDGAGLVAVRARIDGRPLGQLDHLRPSPGVQALFPASDDPRHPEVGFSGRFELDLPAGDYWLSIEAEGGDGLRSTVASAWIRWRPQGTR